MTAHSRGLLKEGLRLKIPLTGRARCGISNSAIDSKEHHSHKAASSHPFTLASSSTINSRLLKLQSSHLTRHGYHQPSFPPDTSAAEAPVAVAAAVPPSHTPPVPPSHNPINHQPQTPRERQPLERTQCRCSLPRAHRRTQLIPRVKTIISSNFRRHGRKPRQPNSQPISNCGEEEVGVEGGREGTKGSSIQLLLLGLPTRCGCFVPTTERQRGSRVRGR
ncbi:hypothetical protein K440DRAFT_373039 [Wilcoxina mikolae CBS 423.85]|nr:hypothetical protein K440DRAFT_373039 [Wilcoxina mikolae CBS 423.85]